MRRRIGMIALLVFVVASHARAVEVATLLKGLNNPRGVAVQPESNQVFVSESGAGRVVRFVDGVAEEVIGGFATQVAADDPSLKIGPLGLVFLSPKVLVVGSGGRGEGEDCLRVFSVPAAGGEALAVDAATASLSLPKTDKLAGEGNFHSLAATRYFVYVTGRGDAKNGWVNRARFKVGQLTELARFVATRMATDVDGPTALTVSPQGELVVGQMGQLDTPGDSLVTFYNAINGQLLLNLPAGLHDISGLAYSPKGQLYATDAAWQRPDEGGLYQIIAELADDRQVLRPQKILALEHPTALAFAPDGTLYLTTAGGQLLKLPPAESGAKPNE